MKLTFRSFPCPSLPRSALDNESEALVQQALDRVSVGRTTLTVAHRLSTIRGADRIFVLDGGKIVESGSHDELIARKGRYVEVRSVFYYIPRRTLLTRLPYLAPAVGSGSAIGGGRGQDDAPVDLVAAATFEREYFMFLCIQTTLMYLVHPCWIGPEGKRGKETRGQLRNEWSSPNSPSLPPFFSRPSTTLPDQSLSSALVPFPSSPHVSS